MDAENAERHRDIFAATLNEYRFSERRIFMRQAVRRESAAERDFALAVRSFKLAEHDLALKLARKAARNGSARAQYFLGLLYEHGFSRGLAHEPERKREKKRASFWRQKALDSGYEKKSEALVRPSSEEEWLFVAGMYADPDSPRRNDDRAAEYYRRAANGDPEHRDRHGRSCAMLAMKALLELYGAGRGMAADADLWLMERAAGGDALAMSALESLFAEGRGKSGERERAVRWLKKSFQENRDENAGRFELGLRYLEGRGVERNDALAARWLERAAGCGHDAARFMTGHFYREGRGVEQNAAEAVRCYRQSCEGIVCEHDEESVGEYLDGLRRMAGAEAWGAIRAWLREEAERGGADACFVLGVLYLGGLGVGKNHERAAFWVKKAALAGDADAQYLFGNFAERGICMAGNPKAALRWREKAAETNFLFTLDDECFGVAAEKEKEKRGPRVLADGISSDEKKRWLRGQSKKGNPFAQYHLACFAHAGNRARRAALLRQSADRGNASAQGLLGGACCSGDGVKQDYVQAAYWLRRASLNPETSPHFDNEPGLAQSDLGHLYREGKGVERDPALAAHWYETSLTGCNCGAALALAMARECGHGVAADPEKARHLYASGMGNARLGANELAAFFLELMDDSTDGDV
jgi:TPR repeat protein